MSQVNGRLLNVGITKNYQKAIYIFTIDNAQKFCFFSIFQFFPKFFVIKPNFVLDLSKYFKDIQTVQLQTNKCVLKNCTISFWQKTMCKCMAYSDLMTVIRDVLQGTITGLILLLIYINYLLKLQINGDIYMK